MRGIISGLMACVILVPLTGGCDRTVSEKETVTRHRDGTVTKDRRTVKERADGTRTVERELDVDR